MTSKTNPQFGPHDVDWQTESTVWMLAACTDGIYALWQKEGAGTYFEDFADDFIDLLLHNVQIVHEYATTVPTRPQMKRRRLRRVA